MTVRLGLIGSGFIARIHAESLRALIAARCIDAELVAVCDSEPRRADRLAGRTGARAVDRPEDVVEACDAVWVCTPTSTHRELVSLVAGAGRAVFCEKPVGRDLAEAATVAKVVADAGVPHQVGLVLRFTPAFRALHDLVVGGRLGRILGAAFRDDQFLPTQGRYASTWRSDVAVAGGGTLLEHSVHDLDVLAWLLGQPQRVAAHTAAFAGHPGIEDLASVLLEFPGGRAATLTSVWHQVLSRPSTRRLEVFGEDAVAWLEDEWVGPLYVQDSDGVRAVPCPHPDWVVDLPVEDDVRDALGAYAAANRAFVTALLDGTSPRPGIDEALTAHGLVDAAYLAARSKAWVDVW